METELRLLFTTIILALLSQPVWALEVFYCVDSEVIDVTKNGVKSLKQERFKMAINRQTKIVTIKRPNKKEPSKMVIMRISSAPTIWFTAAEEFDGKIDSLAAFHNGILTYSYTGISGIWAYIAECEKF